MLIQFDEKVINGKLVALNNKDLPFEIKRIFYIYDVETVVTRGKHGHKSCSQMLICLNGQCTITLDTYKNKNTYVLNETNRNTGVLIVPYTWTTFECSIGCVILVICNEEFNKEEYIYNYDEIIEHHKNY